MATVYFAEDRKHYWDSMRYMVALGLVLLSGCQATKDEPSQWEYAAYRRESQPCPVMCFTFTTAGSTGTSPDSVLAGNFESELIGKVCPEMTPPEEHGRYDITHAKLLDCFGSHGWELVWVDRNPDLRDTYTFKRQKQ